MTKVRAKTETDKSRNKTKANKQHERLFDLLLPPSSNSNCKCAGLKKSFTPGVDFLFFKMLVWFTTICEH